MATRFRTPNRAEASGRLIGDAGKPGSPPSSKIRNDDICAEVELRLVEDDPAARPATSAVKRAGQLASKRRRGLRVPKRRAWSREQFAVHDFRHQPIRQDRKSTRLN